MAPSRLLQNTIAKNGLSSSIILMRRCVFSSGFIIYTRWSIDSSVMCFPSAVTETGLDIYAFARFRILSGIVAENSNSCLLASVWLMRFSISGKKPICNIWSASSSTTRRIQSKCREPRFAWSNNRPGVPRITWGRRPSCCSWASIVLPPMRGRISTFKIEPSSFASSEICLISSRVGAMISTCSWWTSVCTRCKIGSKKASVFPVPVWAFAMTSFPLKTTGMDCSWIGVGSLIPCFCRAMMSSSQTPKDLKDFMDCPFYNIYYINYTVCTY